jgi:putative salt-induced outer membrane protein
MLTRNTLLAALLITPLTAMAAEDSAWSGGAELGTIFTSGNTDTQSINGNFNAKHTGDVWDSMVKLEALTSKEDYVTSKEKYSVFTQFDRNFTERSYLAIVAQQERARFSGYTYQTSASVNYGYRAIKQDNMQLDLEAGPGFRRDKLKETDEIEEGAIARLALNYSWTISEGVKFIEIFSAEMGSDQSVYKSETGLQSQLSGSLATKLTYKVKYVEEVPAETENTDSEFGVTLVYSF